MREVCVAVLGIRGRRRPGAALRLPGLGGDGRLRGMWVKGGEEPFESEQGPGCAGLAVRAEVVVVGTVWVISLEAWVFRCVVVSPVRHVSVHHTYHIRIMVM